MEVLFDLIVRGFIIRFFGINTRYLFFKLIGKSIDKESLSGDKANDNYNNFSQGLINFVVGIVSFSFISFIIVYLMYLIGIL